MGRKLTGQWWKMCSNAKGVPYGKQTGYFSDLTGRIEEEIFSFGLHLQKISVHHGRAGTAEQLGHSSKNTEERAFRQVAEHKQGSETFRGPPATLHLLKVQSLLKNSQVLIHFHAGSSAMCFH